MDKKVIALVIFVFGFGLLVTGVLLVEQNKSNPSLSSQADVTPSQQDSDGVSEPDVVSFTSEEVGAHDKNDDCWTIIGGGVYDITRYLPIHPGGEEILRACGTDATSLFSDRRTEDGNIVGSGTPHSSSAYSNLGQFFIGNLVD